MNILIDVRSIMQPIGTGVAAYTYGLLSAVFAADATHTYTLFLNGASVDPSVVPQTWHRPNVKVAISAWPNKCLNGSIAAVRWPTIDGRLFHSASTRSFDYVFSPNIHFTAVSHRVKHVLTIHDLSFEHLPDCFTPKQRLWHRLAAPRRQCRQAETIIVPSEHTKDDVCETYDIDARKIVVISPGIPERPEPTAADMERVRKTYRLPDRYILYFGTLEPRKNIVGVVEAYQRAKRRFRVPYALVVAGAPGWEQQALLDRIRREDNVHMIGYVAPGDVAALYAGAGLFVFPSLYEGFGFPPLEAMQQGVPVITSDRSSLPEVTGEGAYHVNPYNFDDIAGAMCDLINDAELRAWYVEAGRRVIGRYSWKQAAETWLGICSKD